jgi:predicted NBD/HSP70 family sugar kinase
MRSVAGGTGDERGPTHGAVVPVLELGGTHVAAARVDLAIGDLLGGAHSEAVHPSGGAVEILDAIVSCGRSLTARAGERWGVAVPGPFDYEAGTAFYEGVGKFEALFGIEVGAALSARLPGPPGQIVFLNDADAFLLGEWLFGAAAGSDRCAAVTLGTGIGSAFMSDGYLRQHGDGVPPQGRVDLLTIAGQPLEDVVSTRAVEREYARRRGVVPDGAADVAQRARRGERVAGDILAFAFTSLGRALRPWLDRFGAQVLVVGGAMTGSWDLLGPSLLEGVAGGPGQSRPGLEIRVAHRPRSAALLGAAAQAHWGVEGIAARGGGGPPVTVR